MKAAPAATFKDLKGGPKSTDPKDLSEFTLAVCKQLQRASPEAAKTYSPENVLKTWEENREADEAFKEGQYVIRVPPSTKLRSLSGDLYGD